MHKITLSFSVIEIMTGISERRNDSLVNVAVANSYRLNIVV